MLDQQSALSRPTLPHLCACAVLGKTFVLIAIAISKYLTSVRPVFDLCLTSVCANRPRFNGCSVHPLHLFYTCFTPALHLFAIRDSRHYPSGLHLVYTWLDTVPLSVSAMAVFRSDKVSDGCIRYDCVSDDSASDDCISDGRISDDRVSGVTISVVTISAMTISVMTGGGT